MLQRLLVALPRPRLGGFVGGLVACGGGAAAAGRRVAEALSRYSDYGVCRILVGGGGVPDASGDTVPAVDEPASLSFTTDAVAGSTPCNQFNGSYTVATR